jgi:hypothetical protein
MGSGSRPDSSLASATFRPFRFRQLPLDEGKAKPRLNFVQKLFSPLHLCQDLVMKFNSLLLAACAALAVWSVCQGRDAGLVLDPVGPAHGGASAATGNLVVYSAFSLQPSWPSEPSYRQHYSNYDLQSAEGRTLRTVSNDSGLAVAMPAVVTLPPGAYRVVARANGFGEVTVPVIVTAGRTTTIHLEGGRAKPADAEEMVRLPDGRVVGWRADQ